MASKKQILKKLYDNGIGVVKETSKKDIDKKKILEQLYSDGLVDKTVYKKNNVIVYQLNNKGYYYVRDNYS